MDLKITKKDAKIKQHYRNVLENNLARHRNSTNEYIELSDQVIFHNYDEGTYITTTHSKSYEEFNNSLTDNTGQTLLTSYKGLIPPGTKTIKRLPNDIYEYEIELSTLFQPFIVRAEYDLAGFVLFEKVNYIKKPITMIMTTQYPMSGRTQKFLQIKEITTGNVRLEGLENRANSIPIRNIYQFMLDFKTLRLQDNNLKKVVEGEMDLLEYRGED